MAKRLTAIEKAIAALEAEITPLEQQITARVSAINALRDQQLVVRRKKAAKKLDHVTAPGPMEVAGSSGD